MGCTATRQSSPAIKPPPSGYVYITKEELDKILLDAAVRTAKDALSQVNNGRIEESLQQVLPELLPKPTNPLDPKYVEMYRQRQAYISDWYQTVVTSEIFHGFDFKKEKYPLSFLSSRLSQFTKATRIFTTRDHIHNNVAAEFHQACDNIPNTLVIIKSGQYIAGGYTEVAWEKSNVYMYSPDNFVFSVNKRRVYAPLNVPNDQLCWASMGPFFRTSGSYAICVHDKYR